MLELNASDERGIDVVRDKIKSFARTTVAEGAGGPGSPPPYKIIILDEADSMTADAQSALRRVMEMYSSVTRFCLCCNYISRCFVVFLWLFVAKCLPVALHRSLNKVYRTIKKSIRIIEPIASRCAKFRFRPLETSAALARLQHVASAEGVGITPEALQSLIKVSSGDLRKCIMLLQSAHRLYGARGVTGAGIAEIAGIVPADVVAGVLEAWKGRDLRRIRAAVTGMMRAGYSGAQVLAQLQEALVQDAHLDSLQKARMALSLGRVDRALVDGADEELQLLSLLVAAY